jgi:phosphomannomutase
VTSPSASLDAIFKAYDIRGVYPDQIDESVARLVGGAFASFTKAPRILVGRDARPSSPALADAFTDGATTAGTDVVDLGLASTDLVYFASGDLDAPAAMFTASHNPPEYNGIKLCRAGAAPVGADTGLQELEATVAAGELPAASEPGRRSERDLLPAFVDHVRSFIDVDALRGQRLVADTANGLGGLVVPAVFAGLPVEVELLYGDLDGTFPNHPANPIQPENLVDLQRAVRERGADAGLAFDGDADRVFLVDERAEPLSGSLTTTIVAASILQRLPAGASDADRTVVHNLICSKAVPEVVRELGGTPVRTRVGHSFIKQVMADTGAGFGGEHSGHYYFRDNYRADSGIIAALVVLETLARSGVPLSELRRPYERYAQSGEVNRRVDDPAAVLERVAAAHSDAGQDRLDGLTVDHGDWWFNLRPSNTEPLLRLNLEAADAASCRQHTDEVLTLVGGEAD